LFFSSYFQLLQAMIHFGHGLHRTTRLYHQHAGVFSAFTRAGLMFGFAGEVGPGWDGLAPIESILIGLTVTAIIGVLAPLTQAGLNPARDFGPRLFAYLAGWGNVAIPGPSGGFFSVYLLGPFMGGIISALLFSRVFEPLMERKTAGCACEEAPLIFGKAESNRVG
jgi:glycerol uptake facilitator-like aquaporin